MRIACGNQLSPTQNLIAAGIQASARNADATVTYATWNPLDKGTGVTLSNGDLTIVGTGAGQNFGRSTIGKSSGKWYWEYHVDSVTGYGPMFGIAKSTASFTPNWLGGDADGYGYYCPNGNKYNNGSGSAYGASVAVGDTVGVALDMDAGTVTFYKNNVSQGVAFSGLTGTVYAAGPGAGAASQTVTANFGATALAYTPPTGFNAGLYT